LCPVLVEQRNLSVRKPTALQPLLISSLGEGKSDQLRAKIVDCLVACAIAMAVQVIPGLQIRPLR
jgi:hypothetical protein